MYCKQNNNYETIHNTTMNIAELKLDIIKKIMESDDEELAFKLEQLFSNNNNTTVKETEPDFYESFNTIIAYKADGQPLTIKNLKAEILEITDDGCKGAKPASHCSVKTRLKGILWL